MLVLVFTGVVLVALVTILGESLVVAVPYWRSSHCLSVSMEMLFFVIFELIVTHLDFHVCSVRN